MKHAPGLYICKGCGHRCHLPSDAKAFTDRARTSVAALANGPMEALPKRLVCFADGCRGAYELADFDDTAHAQTQHGDE